MSFKVIKQEKIEIRHLFSLKMALNIHETGFTIPKTTSDCKKWKIWNILRLRASNLAPKMGCWRPAWQFACSSSSVAR